jgi:colanic acid/amylovoran biosynthesis glycosyltransferase
MRICYVLNQFPELSQTFVLQQALDLVSRGHRVDVVAARVGSDTAQHMALRQAAGGNGAGLHVEYTGMPEHLGKRLWMGARLGVRVARVRPQLVATALDVRRFGWFAASGSLLAMGVPLAGERRCYDAIIAHFGPQGMIAQGLREMDLLEGPLVTFFHAYDLTSAPRLVGRGMYRRLFERGELHVAISERGATLLCELGAPAVRVRVHHMGINVELFQPPSRPRRHNPGEAGRIISIGRLVGKKGFDHGLRAVAKARAQGVLLDYAIYGTGPLHAHLERSIEALGLRGCARLCGAASQAQLAKALQRAHVLMAPSITARNGDEEGVPMVLMEAMATELPVLATDSGAVRELVSDDVNGLLVPEADSDALCAALRRLMASPELTVRLGRAARERVVAGFNQLEQGRRLVTMLEELSWLRTGSSHPVSPIVMPGGPEVRD